MRAGIATRGRAGIATRGRAGIAARGRAGIATRGRAGHAAVVVAVYGLEHALDTGTTHVTGTAAYPAYKTRHLVTTVAMDTSPTLV